MVKRKGAGKERDTLQLTDVELEVMTILWRLGEGTVRDVMAALPAGRDLAYTSVSTMLRILEQKGAVATRKEGQSHVYVPLLAKHAYEGTALKRMVSTLFDGAADGLVARLLDDPNLSKAELARLREMLDARIGK